MNNVIRLFYRGFEEHDHIDSEDGSDLIGKAIMESFNSKVCPNCNFPMHEYSHFDMKSFKINDFKSERIENGGLGYVISICRTCGWWQLKSDVRHGETISNWAYQYHSLLESIDISKDDVVMSDLRSQLLENWEDRKLISAHGAEALVRDILKDHLACDVLKVTSNTNTPDGGIDLYVCSQNGQIKTAIQVKRRKNRDVENIREVRNFVGALVIEGLKKGIFVTTAQRFTKPAQNLATNQNIRKQKLELDLIDGEKLLEMLKSRTKPKEFQLPMGLNDLTQWKDPKGNIFTVKELF